MWGTGTGILAMLASQLGAQNISMTEVDEMALEVAVKNVELNKFENIKAADADLSKLKFTFNIVIANIIDGVLVQLKNDLKRLTQAGGYLVLTGILEEREEGFKKSFGLVDNGAIDSTDGYKIINRIQKGEWVGLLVRKTP